MTAGDYVFGKNQFAVSDESTVSLTSQFGGSFKTKDTGYTVVDGSKVEKNLTFKGTSANETLIGGNNSKKKKSKRG